MVIVCTFLPAAGMALFPFILVKKAAYKTDEVLLNHERIHLRQQIELLVLPFYVLYLLNYLFNLVKYQNHSLAYHNILFEKEAYAFDSDLQYLKRRKPYQWLYA